MSKQNNLEVVPEVGDARDGDVANQKIQLRDGEHALLLVEGQAFGGQGGEQRGGGKTPSVSKKKEKHILLYISYTSTVF
jgi:hypothetical protein